MKKFKRITALILSLLMLSTCMWTAAAEAEPANTIEASVDNATRKVTMSGTSIQFRNTVVAVTVLYPNSSLPTGNEGDLDEVSAYIGSTKVKSNMTFDLSFYLKTTAISGVYTVVVNIPGEAKPLTATFNYSDIVAAAKVMSVVTNTDKGATEIKAEFDAKMTAIDVPLAVKYKGFTEVQKTYVAKVIADMSPRPADQAKLIDALTAVTDKIIKVNELVAGDRIKLKEIIEAERASVEAESVSTYFAIPKSTFDSYDKLDEGQRAQALVIIFNKRANFALPQDVAKAFADAIPEAAKTPVGTTPAPEPGLGGGGGAGGGGGSSSVVSVAPGLIPSPDDKEKPTAFGKFKDLEGVEWAKAAITVLSEKGIINGKSADEFCPNDVITREEIVKLLVTAFKINGTQKAAIPFTDVEFEDWYYESIFNAWNANITKGITATEFGVGQPVLRQDIASLLTNTLQFANKTIIVEEAKEPAEGETVEEAPIFVDEDQIEAYAIGPVKKLFKAGIINGRGEGMFAPRESATRAEAAVIIYRVMYRFNMI